MMKNIILFALVMFVLSCTNKRKESDKVLLEQIDSLKLELKNIYKPGFGELMSGIQNHHTKLWFAGLAENWKLASFEIHEIKELLEDLEKFQSNRKETESIEIINPFIADLEDIINAKDTKKFKLGYSKITKYCNECHEITKYEYIKIVVPDKNPFANQVY